MGVYLKIRHGSSLHLGNEKFSKEQIKWVIMGHRVLESNGWRNKHMLEAACERCGEMIEVGKELVKDGNDGREGGETVLIFEESMFHNLAKAGKNDNKDDY